MAKKRRTIYRDPQTGRIISKKKAIELGLVKETKRKTGEKKTQKTGMIWNGWRWISK